jgi:hypothetical protein
MFILIFLSTSSPSATTTSLKNRNPEGRSTLIFFDKKTSPAIAFASWLTP